jgi:hypothetical protein
MNQVSTVKWCISMIRSIRLSDLAIPSSRDRRGPAIETRSLESASPIHRPWAIHYQSCCRERPQSGPSGYKSRTQDRRSNISQLVDRLVQDPLVRQVLDQRSPVPPPHTKDRSSCNIFAEGMTYPSFMLLHVAFVWGVGHRLGSIARLVTHSDA